VHIWAVDMHVELQLLTNSLDVLQALLVVWAGTTDPDLDLVLAQDRSELPECSNDALECRGDVGEVSDTATDEEDFALIGIGSAEHEVEDGSGVVECLRLGWGTRVLAVVGKFGCEPSRGNGVSVDDGGTTTGDEGPDTTCGVENGEFERCAGLGIKVGNVLFLLAHLTTKGSGEFHGWASINCDFAVSLDSWETESRGATSNGPFDTAFEFGSLVEFGGKIKEVDFGGGALSIGNDNERVDLEVGKLAVDVDSVEARDEVHEDIVYALWYLFEESSRELFVRGIFLEVDWDEDFLGLSVNITNIYTTFVREENPIALRQKLVFSCQFPLKLRTSRTELMLM
jgi:hypothetical protein